MEDVQSYRLAAIKAGGNEKPNRSLVDEPWNQTMFSRSPGHGQDQWIETMRSEGWLVRSHSKWRSRTFQPLHKTLPLDPKEFTGLRVSVGFDADEKRVVMQDECLKPSVDLFVPKKQWKGWTFLQLKRPSPNHYGEHLCGSMDEAELKKANYQESDRSEATLDGPEEEKPSSSTGRGQRSGYALGSTIEKGTLVANQLPIPPAVLKEVEKDDEGSEWAWVTDFEKVG